MRRTVSTDRFVGLSPIVHRAPTVAVRLVATSTLICLLLTICSTSAVAQVGSWTTGSITTHGDTNNFVAVTTDSSGNFHGAWRPDSGPTGYIEIGSWNGSSWTTVATLNTSTDSPDIFTSFSDDVSVAVDSTGDYHVAFKGMVDGPCCGQERGVYYAKYDVSATSWSIVEKVQTGSHPSGWKGWDDPKIDVDSSNNPHMSFHFSNADDTTDPPRQHKIRYASRATGSWVISDIDDTDCSGVSPGPLSPGSAFCLELENFDFELDSNDKAHLVYGEERGDNRDFDLVYATNVLGSFSTAVLKDLGDGDNTTGPGIGDANLEIDSGDDVHISFSQLDTTSYLGYLTNATGSFIETTAVNGVSGGSPNAIGVNADASLKVIAYDGSIRAATKAGPDPWQDEQVASGAGAGRFMDATMNDSGEIMIIFHNEVADGTDERVQFAFGILTGGGAVCGDGNVEGDEDCDGTPCCTGSCTFAASGTNCGSGPTECSGQDTCNGSGTCQANHFAAGTACGDGTVTDCDLADECDGAGVCDDNLVPDGTLCDDGDICSTTDTCAAGVCIGGPDETAPTIDCSRIDPARSADVGVCTFTMPGTGFDPAFSDNCPGATVANDFDGADTLAGATFDVGPTTVEWTVTDGAGATATCSVDIMITDDEDPTIVCSADVEAEPTGPDGANVSYDAPTVADNCPGATAACVPASGSLFAIGDTVITCTATDGADNTANCSFIVTVLSPEEVVEKLIDNAQMLGDDGVLNYGQTNSLVKKLAAVLARLAAGRTHPACNILNAFINSLNGMVKGGTLTASEAQPLIDSATNARAALECDSAADATAKSRRDNR